MPRDAETSVHIPTKPPHEPPHYVTVQPLHNFRHQLQQPNAAARPHRTVNKCNNRIWQICLPAERINYRLKVTEAWTCDSRIQ